MSFIIVQMHAQLSEGLSVSVTIGTRQISGTLVPAESDNHAMICHQFESKARDV